MTIQAIARNFNGDPNIVTIVTDDDLTAITTTGYWDLAETKDSVETLQNGVWEWKSTDLVIIHYATNLINFFVFDAANSCFDALNPAAGLSDVLQSANIFVGNSSNIATGVAVSGDITISDTGVVAIASDVIVNADINASAGIAFSKLATLSSGNIIVGSAGNVATSVAVTGDVLISNTGVTSIGGGAVELGMLATGISPSHVIKFADQLTTNGTSASEAFTVTGAQSGDLAFLQLVTQGTNNVTILTSVVAANTLTVTFSADPGSDAVFNYQIIRAAA